MLLVAAFLVVNAGVVSALELVHFPSAVVPPGGMTESEDTTLVEPLTGYPIWGHLGKPDGAGPFPALVLLHGCGGVREKHLRWASHFNDLGYVTLIVDSFRPRSIVSICKGAGSTSASYTVRTLDALGAHAFLRTLHFVKRDNIGVIGWSHGGITALAAVAKHGVGEKFPSNFAAAIGFYPLCVTDRSFGVPTLVLIGKEDDWTPAGPCIELRERNRNSENSFDLVVYDGAFHAFDDSDIGTGFFVPGVPGDMHWIAYDKAAHEDSVERTKSFLSKYLAE